MRTTKHRATCTKAFARLDPECPRCQELAAGAARRRGWGQTRREQEAGRRAEIAAHYVNGRCACGPVCTQFDW